MSGLNELFRVLLTGYLVLAFIKVMLVSVDLFLAAHVMARKGVNGGSIIHNVLLLMVVMPVGTFISWPKALVNEGLGFFVVYQKRQLIRGILAAIREQ